MVPFSHCIPFSTSLCICRSHISFSLFCRFLSFTSICSLSFLYLLLHFYLVYLPPLIYPLCLFVFEFMSLSTCHCPLYLHFRLFCRVLMAFFKTVQGTEVSQRRLCIFCKNWWNTLPHRVGRVLSFSPVVRIGTPQPLTRRRVCPPPSPRFLGGGAHSLAREGVGESQFRKGDIHWYSVYVCTLCFTPKAFSWNSMLWAQVIQVLMLRSKRY